MIVYKGPGYPENEEWKPLCCYRHCTKKVVANHPVWVRDFMMDCEVCDEHSKLLIETVLRIKRDL
jgi:hypothetical protein